MTFFYDLNKKLKEVLDAPKSEHKQLNEGTVAEVSDKKLAAYQAKADKQIAAGQNVEKRTAGLLRTSHSARRNKGLDPYADTANLKNYPLGEEGMSRAAKGYEKYGKEGMEALAKAGREGKALDPIRDKYNKYDESVEEGVVDWAKEKYYDYKMGKELGKAEKATRRGDTAAAAAANQAAGAHGDKVLATRYKATGSTMNKKSNHLPGSDQDQKNIARLKQQGFVHEEGMEEGLGDMARKVGGAVKKVAGKALDTLGHGSDEDLIRDMQKKAGLPQTGKKPQTIAFHKSNTVDDNAVVGKVKEAGAPMSAKQKSFAALAEPKDKITFADKIAGAKKEVDEMLGDVAANAMKSAITSKGGTVTKTKGGIKHSAGPGVYGGSDKDDSHLVDRLKGPKMKKVKGREETDEGWDEMMKSVRDRAEKPKVGSVERGHKHDIEHTATGRRVTRRTDDQGISVGADDDETSKADAPKRGRGRPKGTGGKMGAKGPSGKSKLMTKEADHDSTEVKHAMAVLKKAGYKVEKAEEELEEKAVSKKQQRFMGMVHAAQKGEKPASKEVAKVAKSMGKKDAEDFAATKHKGLPEKKKPEGKKKEKTEEAGGSGTPTASSGFSFGKGIYDSYNRDLEDMIAESMARLDSTLNESMSINMSNSTEGGKSLTITATEEDAMKLAAILKMAGLDSAESSSGGDCGCGSTPCSCEEQVHEVDENQPDYPTNTETSDNALQYSGGLNAPKSTGQTTVPVIASQEERQQSYAEAEEAAIRRMMEMAGIKEGKKDVEEEKTEEGNLFTGNLAKARAAGKKEADLDGDGDMEKVRENVDESILAATRNLWKTYQPK